MRVPFCAARTMGVREQLGAVFPEGAIAPGDIVGMASLLRDWHQSAALPSRTNPFTLENMLSKTMSVYEALATRS